MAVPAASDGTEVGLPGAGAGAEHGRMKPRLVIALAALTLIARAEEPAPLPWAPLDPPVRWDLRLQAPELGPTPDGELRPALRPDGVRVAFVIDPASLSADGTSALLRPRPGFGLPPHALRVDPTEAMVLGFAPPEKAGYATDAMLRSAPLPVGHGSDGSFRLEWTEPTGPLRLVPTEVVKAAAELPVRCLGKAPGVALGFVAPGDGWILVNHLTLSAGPAIPWRTADLLVRKQALNYGPATEEPFDALAWRYFCSRTGLSDAETGGTEMDGRRRRGTFFHSWSMILRKTAAFWMLTEPAADGVSHLGLVTFDLESRDFVEGWFTRIASGKVLQPWVSGGDSPAPHPLPPELAVPSFADRMLHGAESAASHRPWMQDNLTRAVKGWPDRADKLTAEQLEWEAMLATEGYVEVLRSWALFPDTAIGQAASIMARGRELEAMVKKARANATGGQLVSHSPNGRWALRLRFDELDADNSRAPILADLVDAATGSVLMNLIDAQHDEIRTEPRLVWRADSSGFAFHARGRRLDRLNVFLRIGAEFTGIELPGTEEKAPRARRGEKFHHFEGETLVPRRWLKNGDLEVDGTHAVTASVNDGESTRSVTLHWTTVVAFDVKKRAAVVRKETSHETREDD